MNTVELPALDGREPLGFLAALGVLRVLAEESGIPARLSFSDTTACALLHSPLPTTEDIAEALAQVVSSIEDGAVLPGIGPGFPPASGLGKDPLRWPRQEYRQRAAALRRTHPLAAERWLPCLTTDLAIDAQGRAALSPFLAPAGQQKIHTFFEKPLKAVRDNPDYLHQALTRWRRIEGFTGEYLDHRVLRSAADDPQGRAGREAGVPGATWLATMALPLFRLTGDGQKLRSTLWHRVANTHIMIWPLWTPALDPDAIRCLLELPTFTPLDDRPTVSPSHWAALGVFSVHGAHRQRIPGRNFDGVLSPYPSTSAEPTPANVIVS